MAGSVKHHQKKTFPCMIAFGLVLFHTRTVKTSPPTSSRMEKKSVIPPVALVVLFLARFHRGEGFAPPLGTHWLLHRGHLQPFII